MTTQLPQPTSPLNLPDHAFSHRVFANDNLAPEQSVVVDSSGNVNISQNIIVNSVISTAYVSTAVNYLMLAGDYLIEVTAAGKTVTLMTPIGRTGKIVIIKNSSTGICDILTAGGTIDGISDVMLGTMDGLSVISNGANWLVF